MTQFDRITRESGLHHGGFAFIRDTDIPINEIVMLVQSGWSHTDILAQYPSLEIDDILQALAFSIHDLLESVAYWRHEGLTPLTHIKGYSEILGNKTDIVNPSEIDDEQRQEIMTIIVENTWRAIAYWKQLRRWTKLHFEEPDYEYDELQIATILNHLEQRIKNQEPTAILKAHVDDAKFSVRANEGIITAILNIVIAAKDTFEPQTNLTIHTETEQVNFQLQRKLKYSGDRLDYLIEPYTPLAIAAMYLYQNGASLSLSQQDDLIYFEFTLPKASN